MTACCPRWLLGHRCLCISPLLPPSQIGPAKLPPVPRSLLLAESPIVVFPVPYPQFSCPPRPDVNLSAFCAAPQLLLVETSGPRCATFPSGPGESKGRFSISFFSFGTSLGEEFLSSPLVSYSVNSLSVLLLESYSWFFSFLTLFPPE